MKKTIVAAVDFSLASVNAATYAVHMAKDIDASLVLFHVIDVSLNISELPVAGTIQPQLEADAVTQLQALKEKLAAVAGNNLEISATCVVGTVLFELKTLCSSLYPFAVVMGAQGKSALSRALLGSKTSEAIHHLAYPVLVIPPDTVYTAIRQVAIACDMDNTSSRLPLAVIEELQQLFHAQLHVLHITPTSQPVKVNLVTESVALENQLSHYQPQFHYLDNDNVTSGINSFIKENRIDLLLAIPGMHSVFSALFHKSITKQLSWHPVIPVLFAHR